MAFRSEGVLACSFSPGPQEHLDQRSKGFRGPRAANARRTRAAQDQKGNAIRGCGLSVVPAEEPWVDRGGACLGS